MTRYLPAVAIATIILLFVIVGGGTAFLLNRSSGGVVVNNGFNTFKDCSDLSIWLNRAKPRSQTRYFEGDALPVTSPNFSTTGGAKAEDNSYSTTNVQVAGVDEADIIKTDGNFVYLVDDSTVRIISIVNGKFSEQSKINLATTPSEMFIQGDTLVIYASGSRNFADSERKESGLDYSDYYYGGQGIIDVYIYNIADRKLPKFQRKVSIEGNYLSSRMIGNTTYVVTNFYSQLSGADITKDNAKNFLPQLADTTSQKEVKYQPIVDCDDVHYTGSYSSQFVTLVAIPLNGETIGKEVLLSNAQNVYASTQNMYVVGTDYAQNQITSCDPVDSFFVPDMCGSRVATESKTNIYKFKLDGVNVEYVAKANVNGQILNQFSMDEFDNSFRIATTAGEVWNERQPSQSTLYIFNDKLEQVGSVGGLGKGEKIYSVRFMGNRAYVVTFKKVDPFYVLDLSNPTSPKVLGELKIPGYSDYLHPFDENHIIGVGKNATDAEQGSFAWYQGLKMALFDVTDPTAPKQMQQVEIGDRGSESEVLSNHKAFLFDRAKELLVIPASVAQIGNKTKDPGFPQYGNVNFRGFLVYKLTLNGFVEKGRISSGNINNNYWWGSNGSRSLYIGNYLITFGDSNLQSHNLQSLAKVDSLKF